MARKPVEDGPTEREALTAALQKALTFSPVQAEQLRLSLPAIQDMAQEEASFGQVAVDERGITPGMRLHLLQPAMSLIAQWRHSRSEVDRLLQPAMADLQAVRDLEAVTEGLRDKREEAKANVERRLEADHRYVQIRDKYTAATDRFERYRSTHDNRPAVMVSRNPLYLLLIVAIGAAEWLINYDTFYSFLGVPAIAAGTTLILGLLLAFAAHQHGAIIRQWSYQFGADKSSAERYSSWRMLGLSTLALLIVLGAAGASRYQAALAAMSAQAAPNILGNDPSLQPTPIRDVMISLLGNVGAWVLGTIISAMAHDPDPNYMDATAEYRRTSRAFFRSRRRVTSELKTIEARSSKDIDAATTAAGVRARRVEAERNVLAQTDTHGAAIVDAVHRVLSANIEAYRDALVRYVLSRRGEVRFKQHIDGTETEVQPFEYRAMALHVPMLTQVAA